MKLIIASDPNGGIGYKNRLPWTNIQGDLPRFKRLTAGGIVVMGRNTWDSLPKKPLPGRLNVVVTSNPSSVHGEGIVVTANSDFSTADDRYWLIGGAQLVNSCWDYINEIHLTKVYDHYACDSFIDLVYIEANYVRTFSEIFPDHAYEIWKRK